MGRGAPPQALHSAAKTASSPRAGTIGQRGGGNGARQDELIVHHGHAAKNKFSQAAGADRGGDGGGAHGNHRSHTNAGDDDAERERQLDAQEQLAVGQAHAASGFNHRAVHAQNSGVRVAQDREQSVEGQRQNRHSFGALTEPRHGQQESEQRKTGNRLEKIRSTENGPHEPRPAGEQNAKRQADGHGKERGETHQPDVLEGERENLVPVVQKKIEQAHSGPPLSPGVVGPAAGPRASPYPLPE